MKEDDDAEESSSSRAIPLLALVQPFIDILSTSGNKLHFQRVILNVFDPLLDALQKAEPIKKKRRTDGTSELLENISSGQEERAGHDILKALFERGASETTNDVSRRRLYSYVARRGYDGEA